MTDKTDQLQLDPNCYEDATSYFEEIQHDPEYRQALLEESVRIRIAQAIHKKRKTLKMSQMALAKKAKTTQRMISRIERANVSVGVDLLQRVATALGSKLTLTIS